MVVIQRRRSDNMGVAPDRRLPKRQLSFGTPGKHRTKDQGAPSSPTGLPPRPPLYEASSYLSNPRVSASPVVCRKSAHYETPTRRGSGSTASSSATSSPEERGPAPIISPLLYSEKKPSRRDSDRDLPVGSSDFSLYSCDTVVQKPTLKRKTTYSFERTERVKTLLWRTIYFGTLVLWAVAYRHHQNTDFMHSQVLDLLESHQYHSTAANESIANLTLQVQELEGRLEAMRHVNHAFHHELQMIQEMANENVDMHMDESQATQSSSMAKWIRQRKRGLEHRIGTLRESLQARSRKAVIEKFGPGPHQVRFKVKTTQFNRDHHDFSSADTTKDFSSLVQQKSLSVTKEFVVETASLDETPHAVHLFLELVHNKLWDDSVFLHNDEIEHLMAAAPIHYKTHNLKSDELDALPFQKLGFPEYSAKRPHKKYTLGFAGVGPTFYINTMDNGKAHGPGGQGHHLLATDADPCFGTIVAGREVVEALIHHGTIGDNRLSRQGSHPWTEQDLAWTRIVSVAIVQRKTG